MHMYTDSCTGACQGDDGRFPVVRYPLVRNLTVQVIENKKTLVLMNRTQAGQPKLRLSKHLEFSSVDSEATLPGPKPPETSLNIADR